MRAALGDPAGIQNEDTVGAAQRAHAVGDEEGGAAAHGAFHGLEDFVLGARIDGRGGVVEDEDLRVEQQGARDGDALSLAAGEVHAGFAEHGVVAVLELGDEVVRAGDARGAFDLFARGCRMAEGDVRGDGVREEEVVLEDDADVRAERLHRKVVQRDAVEGDASGGRVVEARDEREQGGLAGAGGAGDGDGLAGLGDEGDVVQHGGAVTKTEGDMLEGDASAHLGRVDGVGARGDVFRRVQNLKDAPGAVEALLHIVHESGEVRDLRGELLEQSGAEHEAGAEREFLVDDEPAAVAEHDHHREIVQPVEDRPVKAEFAVDLLFAVADGGDGFAEAARLAILDGEGLDRLHALDAFGETQHHRVHAFAVTLVGRAHALGEARRPPPLERQRAEAEQRERDMRAQHERRIHGERDGLDAELHEHAVDEEAHGVRVGGHAVDDGAGGVRVEEPEAESLEFGEDARAQAAHDALVQQLVHAHRVGIDRRHAEEGEGGDASGDGEGHPGGVAVEQSGREPERYVRSGYGRVGGVADMVDAEADEGEHRGSGEHDEHLEREQSDAGRAVFPRQAEQPADEPGVGLRIGDGGLRVRHRKGFGGWLRRWLWRF